jgi:hypothetical protein
MIAHIFDKMLRAEGIPVHRVLLEYFCNDIRGIYEYRGSRHLERYLLNVSDALARNIYSSLSRCDSR